MARRKASERACRVCSAEFQSFNELVNHFLTHYNLSLNNATSKQMRTLRLKEIIPMNSTPTNDDEIAMNDIEFETASSSSTVTLQKHFTSEEKPPLKRSKKEISEHSGDEIQKRIKMNESRSLLKPVYNRLVPQAIMSPKMTTKSKLTSTKPVKKVHICTICGLEFATMSPLVAHFLTHRNLKLNQKQASTITPPTPVIYSCNVCNYQCTAASRLRQHQETHIDQPQVHCPTCHKAFRTQRLLDQHITRQHVKIECKECGQTFLKRNDMVEHYLKHFDLTLKKQH